MAETETIERPATRRVQVPNLPPADSGRGFARLPDKIMDVLGLKEGDVIEIVGKRSTAARALRPYSADEAGSSGSTACSAPTPGSARAISSRSARSSRSRRRASLSRRHRTISACRGRPKH